MDNSSIEIIDISEDDENIIIADKKWLKTLNPIIIETLPWKIRQSPLEAPSKIKKKRLDLKKNKNLATIPAVNGKLKTLKRQLNIQKLMKKYPTAKLYEIKAAISLSKCDLHMADTLLDLGMKIQKSRCKIKHHYIQNLNKKNAEVLENKNSKKITRSNDEQSTTKKSTTLS